MQSPTTTKTQCVFAPRAIAFLRGALTELVATINLPYQFRGIGALLAVDPTGPEAINAVLLPPLGPRASGFRARALLSKESLGGSGDVLLIQL